MSFTRREFVQTGLRGASAVWITAAIACRESSNPARESHALPPDGGAAPPRTLRVLTQEEFNELEALTARIIPTDATPGAKEAGVAWFIDDALATWSSASKFPFSDAIRALQRDAAQAHPGTKRFAALTPEQQDALLTKIEKSEFFGWLRFGAIAGMFALPKYGGNANWVGWDFIGQGRGFEYKPPFGWYDDPKNQQALMGRVL